MLRRNFNPPNVQCAKLSRASSSTIAACQGLWEMLHSGEPPGPSPGASPWRWAEETLASPSAPPPGTLGKITFEPVGRNIDGVCPQGLAGLDGSVASRLALDPGVAFLGFMPQYSSEKWRQSCLFCRILATFHL